MDTSYTFPTLIPGPYAFGNEKLARLEMLLRTDFETTHKHRWDFRDTEAPANCGTAGCAIGFAIAAKVVNAANYLEAVNELQVGGFGDQLFGVYPSNVAIGYGRIRGSQVTPLMVADAIRKYMLTGSLA